MIYQKRTGIPVRFDLDLWSIRHPPFVHDGQFSVYLSPVPDRHTPFFRCFKGGKVQCLQKGLIAWENASLAVQLVVRGVQALDRVRRVDNCPHRTFAENLKIGVITSQSRSQRFMAFGYFSDHFSVIRSRLARPCSSLGAL